MFALKLGLVAASVLLASLAARRYGHSVAGTLAGMPMIAGPIIGFLLLQQPVEQVRAIALATLVCLPAMVAHMVSFAHAARVLPWYGALLAAPITGNVLPCFTWRRHGAVATAALLWGFVRGLFGFVTFFVVLYAGLPVVGAALAYGLAWLAALGVALAVYAFSSLQR